jgi:predicted site-specific integrase-resolvase
MVNDERYTMQAGEVAKRLQVSRETVHNLAETGALSYVERLRGKSQKWRYFNPTEVDDYAVRRGVKSA